MMQNNAHPLPSPFWLLSLRRSAKHEEPRLPRTSDAEILDELPQIWGTEDRAEANHILEDQDPTQNAPEELYRTKAGSRVPRLEAVEMEDISSIKTENYRFWDGIEEKKASSLNLSLNHQDLLEAWSNRGTPSSSTHTNTQFSSESSNGRGGGHRRRRQIQGKAPEQTLLQED